MKYVIIFIPAYNEEGSLLGVIKKIREIFEDSEKRGFQIKIIVVDDGSRDETAKIARDLGVEKVVSHLRNRGLGAATRTGMQTSLEMGADIAVKIDADFQHDPADIERVIMPILEDKADCVFGSRFTGGLEYKMPFYRSLGNRFFSWLTSCISGQKITDAQTGLMAFNRKYLEIFQIISDYNETQQLIIDSLGKNMRIMEVPVIFRKREKGRSFISWRYPLRVMPTILRLFIHINPLRVFVPIGLLIFLVGVILVIPVFTGKISFIGDATIAILILGGIQIIFFGFLADLVSKKR